MKQKIFNASVNTWLCFLFILVLTLVYGLMIRDRGIASSALEIKTDNVKEKLSDPIPLRDLQSKYITANKQSVSEGVQRQTEITSAEVRREVVLMGSQFVFIVEAPRQQALAAISKAAAAIKKLEMNLSSWKPSSDISRLNENAGIRAVKISEKTFELLRIAKKLSKVTNDTFDITVGAVWDLWPFRNPHAVIPSQQEIDQHLNLVDASSIELDEKAGTAYLPKIGMKVNLGAIGKGYAAEVAIEKMKELGIKRAAVSAGGDLYLLGEKNSGPWIVEIEHPRWPGHFIDRFVAGDIAIATSGDAKQYVKKNGKRYSHIIDPRTGWPANDCQSVTIVTKSSVEADAYATAVYVMGTKEGMAWVEKQPGIEALIVDTEGRAHHSSGWRALTKRRVNPSLPDLVEG